MESKSYWKETKSYFRRNRKRYTRKGLIEHLRKTTWFPLQSVADVYRAYLTAAGYLKPQGNSERITLGLPCGTYIKVKEIPKNLTVTQVRREAYGKPPGTLVGFGS